mmetsp:Transcript_2017/g.4419  ORF Transcript_2017/g.4419 Transcript_2017/m.4419 type:complete len:335 (-) Transcript_2017:154-1158(-)
MLLAPRMKVWKTVRKTMKAWTTILKSLKCLPWTMAAMVPQKMKKYPATTRSRRKKARKRVTTRSWTRTTRTMAAAVVASSYSLTGARVKRRRKRGGTSTATTPSNFSMAWRRRPTPDRAGITRRRTAWRGGRGWKAPSPRRAAASAASETSSSTWCSPSDREDVGRSPTAASSWTPPRTSWGTCCAGATWEGWRGCRSSRTRWAFASSGAIGGTAGALPLACLWARPTGRSRRETMRDGRPCTRMVRPVATCSVPGTLLSSAQWNPSLELPSWAPAANTICHSLPTRIRMAANQRALPPMILNCSPAVSRRKTSRFRGRSRRSTNFSAPYTFRR